MLPLKLLPRITERNAIGIQMVVILTLCNRLQLPELIVAGNMELCVWLIVLRRVHYT